jgi:short-subunit dehydrogenase
MATTLDALRGEWALVTGASSGIGEQFARQLAARGLHLVLVARREERLRALAEDLVQRHGVQVRVLALDLAREDFLPVLASATADLHIALLVNNAGFGASGRFLEQPVARDLEMLYLNCRAPLLLTHHYGPAMRARGKGAIVFLASLVGHMAVPRMSHYAATKSYDLLLAEGLAHELEPAGVSVLALCPGETVTEFSEVSGLRRGKGMAADAVVREALAAIGRRRHLVTGAGNRLLVFLARILPRRTMNGVMAGGAAQVHDRRRGDREIRDENDKD